MATRRKTGETLDVDDVFPPQLNPATQLRTVAVPEPSPEPVEYDDVTALNNVLAELGAEEDGGGFVTVFREMSEPSGKKRDEYLERFAVSDFSLDGLKSRWGPGMYKINVYHDGRLAARKVIPIAKDPASAAPPSPTAAPTALDLTPVISAIQQNGEQTLKAILALAQSNQQVQPSRMDMLKELAMMREIVGGNSQPAAPAYDPVTLLKLGVEMAANGGGDSNNSWVGKVIDQLGPVLMPALANAAQQNAAPAARHAYAPPVNPVLAAPAPVSITPPPEENPVNALIRSYLNMLTGAAAKNEPVDEYADSILSIVPESQVAEIENLLRPDDWRDRIRPHTPAIDQHPVWFGALRDTLLQFIDEDKAAHSVMGEVGTHLTAANPGVSVPAHEDANTAITLDNPDISGSDS